MARPSILGVDPGLNVTGYGVIRIGRPEPTFVEAGTIEGGNAKVALPVRLQSLYEAMLALFCEHRPQAMACEQIYSHYAHPQTAVLMAHARGVLCLAAAISGVEVFDYPATQVKMSLTGNGRAGKDQMQRAVRQALHLDVVPEPDDVADALAVALCHAHHGRRA